MQLLLYHMQSAECCFQLSTGVQYLEAYSMCLVSLAYDHMVQHVVYSVQYDHLVYVVSI